MNMLDIPTTVVTFLSGFINGQAEKYKLWAKIVICVSIILIGMGGYLILRKDKLSGEFESDINTKSNTNIKVTQEEVIEKNDVVVKVFDTETVDSNGNDFNAKIYVLGDEFNWVYESCSKIEHNNKEGGFLDYLNPSESETLHRLRGAKAIVTIGVASEEMASGNLIENARAYQRAGHLKKILEENVNVKADFYKLTVGRYVANDKKKNRDGEMMNVNTKQITKHQRPIIIVAVHKQDPQVDLRGTLEEILKEIGNEDSKLIQGFPINFSKYGIFYLGSYFEELTKEQMLEIQRGFKGTDCQI